MALKRDLSDLPTAQKVEGLAPDDTPRWGHLLAARWAEQPTKPTALGTRLRFSSAGGCARKLSLDAHGYRPDPIDLAGHWNMGLGTMIHDAWQAVIVEQFPGAQIEAAGKVEPDCSGSADVVLEHEGRRLLLELKTVGGFKFKLAVGERGPAEGPSDDHMFQLALNARAHDVDEAVLVMVSREVISVGVAERKGFSEVGRFVAEWTFTREQLEPLADREVARNEAILAIVDAGRVAPRHAPDMPSGARIVDVDRGRWELRSDMEVLDTGSTWRCDYCNQRSNCRLFGPDEEDASLVEGVA